MPELPEIETTRLALEPFLKNQFIVDVSIHQPNLRLKVPLHLGEWVKGLNIQSLIRRGKYLIIVLSRRYFLIHLGMSGHLRIAKPEIPLKKHDHIELFLSNGYILRYHDPRRFGLWVYEKSGDINHPLLSRLGIEPLSEAFNSAFLSQKILNRRQPIKQFLMNSEIVVGIGNIYASESLFLSRIHPLLPAHSLSFSQCEQLVNSIQTVLNQSILAGGTTLKDFSSGQGKPGYFSQHLNVYGRDGHHCYVCGSVISKIKLGGRSSFFCSNCQKI